MYIESESTEALIKLVENPDIQEARVRDHSAGGGGPASPASGGGGGGGGGGGAAVAADIDGDDAVDAAPEDVRNLMGTLSNEDEGSTSSSSVVSFRLKGTPMAVESAQRACHSMDYPLLSEYDFRADKQLGDIQMALKSTAVLRPVTILSPLSAFYIGVVNSTTLMRWCSSAAHQYPSISRSHSTLSNLC